VNTLGGLSLPPLTFLETLFMTLTLFTVYLIMQADEIVSALFWTPFLIGAFFLCQYAAPRIGAVVSFDRADSAWWEKKQGPFPKIAVVCMAIAGALSAFLPGTKTLAAAYVVPAIASSQAVQKDFPELYDLAINKLKEQLKPVEATK
jgi:hypothetical protein